MEVDDGSEGGIEDGDETMIEGGNENEGQFENQDEPAIGSEIERFWNWKLYVKLLQLSIGRSWW